jgi:DNA invertase Pin-like site-specific DNA recombinase
MMEDAHQRRFDVVAVARFDRFARSVSHLLRVLKTFKALGIQFGSLPSKLILARPGGK